MKLLTLESNYKSPFNFPVERETGFILHLEVDIFIHP